MNMEKETRNTSWFSGFCKECDYNVVVTQPHQRFPHSDYWWYCSNKECKNHKDGKHTGDMEYPSWVDFGYDLNEYFKIVG